MARGKEAIGMPLRIVFVLHSSFIGSSKFLGSKYRQLNSLTSTRSSWPLTFCSWNVNYEKPGIFRITNKTLRQRGNCRQRHTGFSPDYLPLFILVRWAKVYNSVFNLDKRHFKWHVQMGPKNAKPFIHFCYLHMGSACSWFVWKIALNI